MSIVRSPREDRTLKRCLVFNPYFAVLGGGERYTVALADVIAETHAVTFASPWPPNPALVDQLGFPADLQVEQVQLEDFPRLSRGFDLAVLITLDVPPPAFAARNVLVVQFPRPAAAGGRLAARRAAAALRRYHGVVYSEFVRDWLRRSWHMDSEVLTPGIELAEVTATPKEQLVLSVGRFMGLAENRWNSKRHDVLIDAFSKLPAHMLESWRLVLAGGCAPSPEMDRHLDELREQAAGLPVALEVNVTPVRLRELQDRARLFWHASGFERPASEPEAAEHFGMSTAEAMSHGAIPLVYADGGQVEIVDDAFGRLWTSVPELVTASAALMERSAIELDAMSAAARVAAERFGSERFRAEARAMLARIGATGAPPGRVRRSLGRRRRTVDWHAARAVEATRRETARVVAAVRR